MPFLVSFNVYTTPSFSQLCILLAFFFHICSILLIQVWLLSHTLVLRVHYFDKLDKFVLFLKILTGLFLNILTDYFTVSYCIVFLFCIHNLRTKSEFHVKWICRNKFIIIIIMMMMMLTHSKTILENTVEIKPQPVALDFKNISQYSSRSK